MDMSDLKNIVVLKNLPSNLVDEAIVVLKRNANIKKLEHIENTNKNLKKEEDEKNESNKSKFIVKEAEMVITDYISKIENQSIRKANNKDLEMKYKKLKKCTIVLGIILGITILLLAI